MRDAVTNPNLLSADKILQIGKDLGAAIGAKSDNPVDVLNQVKTIAEGAKATLGAIEGNIKNKHFDTVAKQVGDLDGLLQNSKLTSADMKSAAKTIGTLTLATTKLAADIATGNVVGITVDSAAVFKDALDTVHMLKGAAVKFDAYYKSHIKPMLKVMVKKAIAIEKDIVGDFEKAFHWVGDRLHHKHKDVTKHIDSGTKAPVVDHTADHVDPAAPVVVVAPVVTVTPTAVIDHASELVPAAVIDTAAH